MTRRNPIIPGFASRAALGLLVLCVGCSGSATGPGGGDTDHGYTDVPDIPTPTSPGGDVPAASETVTRVELLTGTYNPLVVDSYGTWRHYRICSGQVTADQQTVDWASRAGSAGRFTPVSSRFRNRRLVLRQTDGTTPVMQQTVNQHPDCGGFPLPGDLDRYTFQGHALSVPVHVRRDRRWELKPLEGGAGDYLLVYPNTSGEVATSYTSGTERSQTEEFGKSLSATVGAEFRVLSASVSGTLSQTFSSSVNISESTTETFTKSVTGKDDKVIQFMVWELVEDYRFTDAEGNALEDPNFVLAPDFMTRRGVAVALQSTEFALD